MIPQEWHKEAWIKNLQFKWSNPREKFVEWCAQFHPEYTSDEAGLIYDSHVITEVPAPIINPIIDATEESTETDNPNGAGKGKKAK